MAPQIASIIATASRLLKTTVSRSEERPCRSTATTISRVSHHQLLLQSLAAVFLIARLTAAGAFSF